MRKITVKVTCFIPEGMYCNHELAKSKPTTRCRFCTEVAKAHFVCVLHNEPLLLEEGILIRKGRGCMTSVKEVRI